MAEYRVWGFIKNKPLKELNWNIDMDGWLGLIINMDGWLVLIIEYCFVQAFNIYEWLDCSFVLLLNIRILQYASRRGSAKSTMNRRWGQAVITRSCEGTNLWVEHSLPSWSRHPWPSGFWFPFMVFHHGIAACSPPPLQTDGFRWLLFCTLLHSMMLILFQSELNMPTQTE